MAGADRLDKIQRMVNNGAGVAVIVLSGILAWSVVSGGMGATRDTAGLASPSARFGLPEEPLVTTGAYQVGRPDAPITLVEYSDFRCPFCARFARTTLPALEAEFVESGQLRIVYKHLPIVALHPDALLAAEGAECAGQQGSFRQMHNDLFDHPTEVDKASLIARAVALGLDETSFAECLESGAMSSKVQRDLDEAQSYGITGTPAFVLGVTQRNGLVKATEVVSGAHPIEAFRAAVERALATAGHDR